MVDDIERVGTSLVTIPNLQRSKKRTELLPVGLHSGTNVPGRESSEPLDRLCMSHGPELFVTGRLVQDTFRFSPGTVLVFGISVPFSGLTHHRWPDDALSWRGIYFPIGFQFASSGLLNTFIIRTVFVTLWHITPDASRRWQGSRLIDQTLYDTTAPMSADSFEHNPPFYLDKLVVHFQAAPSSHSTAFQTLEMRTSRSQLGRGTGYGYTSHSSYMLDILCPVATSPQADD